MALPIGSTLGHYHVTALLGAGGMGEVYRARDTKLHRDVAIKVLAPSLAPDAEGLRGMLREARLLAALNHPHIAQIYGIEDSSGQIALVLELVEGRSLDEIIAASGGGLPPDDVLSLARQIAAALEAAHAKGIIHRDLKPANVRVTREGLVKVLDFGIAKAIAPVGAEHDTRGPTRTSAPTAGAVLGTVGYMSPEQALGGPVDARADVWAFGCVLFEMLTARRAFDGSTSWATVAAILEREPAWEVLPPSVPPALAHVLRRCLDKDAGRRPQSMADVLAGIAGPAVHHAEPSRTRPLARPRRFGRAAAAAVLLAAVAVGSAIVYSWLAWTPPAFANPRQVTAATGVEDYPSSSPDGRTVAYESHEAGNWDIWVTQLGGGGAVNRTALHAADDRYPSWSPDGGRIAFWSERDGGGYYVMPAVGGEATLIAPTPEAGTAKLGPAAWSPDGTELALAHYERTSQATTPVLEIVNVTTRAARRVVFPGREESRFDLSWSPDGRLLAYVDGAQQPAETTRLMVMRLADNAAYEVVDARANVRSPAWSADGRALFFVWNRAGAADLWVRRIGRGGEPAGDPHQVTTGVELRHASVSAAADRLFYAKGRWVANIWRAPLGGSAPATWTEATQITDDQAFIEFVDVSPDGRTLAFSSDRSGNQDLWTLALDTGSLTQLTSHPAPEWAPRWSPDGRRLAFYASRTGDREIYVMAADGSGEVRRLTSSPGLDATPDWSPDGRWVAFRSERTGSSDIWIVPAEGGEARAIEPHPAPDYAPSWSPDGRWIAFGSPRGGRGRLWRVPVPAGAAEPLTHGSSFALRWSRADGRIYFNGTDVGRDLWSIAPGETTPRRETALAGRRGSLGMQPPATDGQYLYFTWRADPADIWAMDLVRR